MYSYEFTKFLKQIFLSFSVINTTSADIKSIYHLFLERKENKRLHKVIFMKYLNSSN